jgi:acetyltransferase
MHVIAWMAKEGLGLNKFLSLGNKLDVAENEALAYFLQDPGTQAVYIYLEGLDNGRELMAIAQKSQKPVFVQLPNVGPETSAIAWSHTASLASDERVIEAACRQAGMLRVKSQAEFLVAAKLVGQPPVRGNKVVILSRSGGEAVIAAYACSQWGFKLPPLAPPLADLIHKRSRSQIIKPTNPIDLGDIFDFSVYSEVMAALCADPEVDAVVLNYGPVYDPERQAARDMAKVFIDLARQAEKPLAVSICSSLEEEAYFRDQLGVPVFHFPGEAVRALAYNRTWSRRPELMMGRKLPRFNLDKVAQLLTDAPSGFLSLPAALSLLPLLGIPVPGWKMAGSQEEALEAAADLGYPVCLKLSAPSLIHKTEVGGVQLNLQNPQDLAAAYARLEAVVRDHLPLGEEWEAVVMSQVLEGEEVIVGSRRDEVFGPVVAFGAGGIWTEVMEDVALRVAPLNTDETRRQILETRMGRILQGVRGKPAADLDALSNALCALSQLMVTFPQIQEVDLNPVRAFLGSRGILALDARVRVGEAGGEIQEIPAEG